MPEAATADVQTSQPSKGARFEIPAEPVNIDAKQPAPAKEVAPTTDPNTEAKATSPETDGDTPKPEVKEELTPEQAAKRDREKEQRRAQNKLEKAYRLRAEAQARAQLLEQQLNEARQATQTQKAEGEPTLAQFDYDPEKYAEAKAKFATEKTQRDLTAKQQQDFQRVQQQQLRTSWNEKVARAEDKYDDFDQVVGDLEPNSPFVAALMKVDNGEDVAYHLGKNPKEASKIAEMYPLDQVLQIALLSAKLSAKPAEPKTPSKAPAPIAPLKGNSPTAPTGPTEEMDLKQWMKMRNKQVHGRA